MVEDFRCQVDENCALLGHYAASSGNILQTFRDNLSVRSSGVKNPKKKKGALRRAHGLRLFGTPKM